MELDKLLNEDQLIAATYLDGHSRIIAGAGSGKTRVITYRIAYLIQSIGIDPRKILAITFTNKAANEMKERIESIVEYQGAGSLICTIHSLCVRILRRHSKLIGYPGSFIIMDNEDQKAILKKIYTELGVDSKVITYKKIISTISDYKMAYITPQRALEMAGQFMGEQTRAQIYKAYVDYQKDNFMLDFDDLLLESYRIFKENPIVLERWQDMFDYIHVDEFQDVGEVEYRLVQMLSKSATTCVVGDPDQTIYSFRGANVNYILDFDKDYFNCKTVYLNQNYRSTSNILHISNTLISNNQNRLDKALFTQQETGKEVIHYTAKSEELEAEYISECIKKIVGNDESRYRDILILYRANYLSRSIEQAFIKHKIKYRIFGGLKFFNRKEIKDALSFIRLVVFEDDLSFERVINVPSRGIGKVTLERIQSLSIKYNKSLYLVLIDHFDEVGFGSKTKKELKQFIGAIDRARKSNLPIHTIFENLLEDTGYLEALRNDVEDNRILNIQELQLAIEEYQKDNEDASFIHYMQDIALYIDNDSVDNDMYVSMMSIHMAKGLEFDYVFVIGLSEGVFPSERSISDSGEEGLEEERRLAYVAFTRAKKQLILTDSFGYSFVTQGSKKQSRFIDELGQDAIIHRGAKEKYKPESILIQSSNQSRPNKQAYKPVQDANFIVGQHINHTVFGRGVVTKIDAVTVEIAFPLPVGMRSLKKDHPSIQNIIH